MKPTLQIDRTKFLDWYFSSEDDYHRHNKDMYEVIESGATYKFSLQDIFKHIGYLPLNVVKNPEAILEADKKAGEIEEPLVDYDIDFGTKKEADHKAGYDILMEYFDSLPDEEKASISKRLEAVGC